MSIYVKEIYISLMRNSMCFMTIQENRKEILSEDGESDHTKTLCSITLNKNIETVLLFFSFVT